MFLDQRTILTIACLLVSTMARTQGEESEKSRSFNNRVNRPLEFRRLNSIQTDERSYNRDGAPSDYLNYLRRSNSPASDVILIAATEDDSKGLNEEEEEELFRIITSKDYEDSSSSDLENFDRIGERMIDRANITEEAKRVVRQVKRQRPGFFWTIARVAFETVNDTRSAIQQISGFVEEAFTPPTTTTRETTVSPITTTAENNSTESEPEEKPFVLTVSGIQTILRRNWRGLVRLFNIEWRDAINQSQTNVREFQRDLGNRISPFLQDNPDVV